MFQAIGWGGWFITNIFFYFTLSDSKREKEPVKYIVLLSILIGLGIIFTHLMRAGIKKYKLLSKKIQQQIVLLILFTLCVAILYAASYVGMTRLFNIHLKTESSVSVFNKIVTISFSNFFILFIWNLIYYMYHYVENNRRNELQTLKLQTLVKQLELQTIKAHINPHFIFNALNSIRALVDENPQRARTAITELSNILRSSMQAEKLETVPLHKELDIVKDYLALEQMRFEERLKIEMDIDEDTLEQQVPPMMLQTLVENAIKHGISKQMNGGFIKVISDFKADHHELVVQNTGQLNGNGHTNGDGFGVKSTQDRLNLLYQGKARFDIHNMGGNMVESKVILPLH